MTTMVADPLLAEYGVKAEIDARLIDIHEKGLHLRPFAFQTAGDDLFTVGYVLDTKPQQLFVRVQKPKQQVQLLTFCFVDMASLGYLMARALGMAEFREDDW